MIKSCEKIQNYGLVKLLKVMKVFHKLLEEFLDFCFIVAKISLFLLFVNLFLVYLFYLFVNLLLVNLFHLFVILFLVNLFHLFLNLLLVNLVLLFVNLFLVNMFHRFFSSNVHCSKPVSSSNVRNCKPVPSSNVRNCKPVSSSNVNPSKSVRSNTCNCSIKYRKNFLPLFLFVSALFWEFLLLGILVNDNFNFSSNNSFYNNTNFLSNNNFYNNTNFLYKTRSNILHNKHQNFLLSNCSYVFYTLLSFKPSYVLNKFIDFTNFVNLFFDIYHYWKTLSNIKNFTESLFPITFSAIFGIFVLKS